ncbi:MAG: hypothetical protein EA380_00420 [Phycisphaeraceae bacterium]|nr:MAG: hypothetical protein EA380_00420 [Phycisphaeraceae bacterium]
MISLRNAAPATVILAVATTAGASYIDTMFQTAADPSTYGNLVQSLDVQAAGYNFQIPAGFTNSGYINNVISGGVPIAELDRTQIRSDVYTVTTAQSFTSGADTINLSPGDMVFAYRIRLTSGSTNTVETLRTWGLTGVDPVLGGSGILAAPDQLIGHGFFIDGASANPAGFGPITTVGSDLEYVPGFFGSVDWNWSPAAVEQLQNTEEITLLLFTKPSPIIDGFAKMLSPSGQAIAGTTFEDTGAPLLIPGVPSPGSVAIIALAGGITLYRRRR